MKNRKSKLIVNEIEWNWLESLGTYVNSNGEMNKRPRDRRNKTNNDSSKSLAINNYLSFDEASRFLLTKYKQELFIFFITNLIERFKYLKELESQGNLNDEFYLNNNPRLKMKGIYYSSKSLRLLLDGKSCNTLLDTLESLGWITIQLQKNPNTKSFFIEDSYLRFITPTSFLLEKSKSKITLTKEWALSKIKSFRESLQNKHLDTHNVIPILAKNLKLFSSESEYFETRKNDELNITIDDFGNRYHNCLSNLKKFYRKNLLLEGECTDESDVSNSQMVSLSILLKDNHSKGVEDFKRLALCGVFYEDIMSNQLFKDKIKSIMRTGKSKKEAAKKIVFQNVFGKVYSREFIQYNLDLVNALKEIHFKNEYGFKYCTYKNVAKACQLLESNIFTKVILELENQNIKFGYIYDSIVSKANEKDKVSSIIKGVYQNEFSIDIKVK